MTVDCIICGSSHHNVVYSVDAFPIFLLLPQHISPQQEHFAPLKIVYCCSCGHIFNSAFIPDSALRMYEIDHISNTPVHNSMNNKLHDIIAFIGVDWLKGKRVLEIGAGSGHLARLMAKWASTVTIFEPSKSLCKAMVPEPNIQLVNTVFHIDSIVQGQTFDLIVCKQVLEHLPDPKSFLADLTKILSVEGRIFIEVPRAEYIVDKAAFADLHYPHVHYFTENNLLKLGSLVHLKQEKRYVTKDLHDMGVIMVPGEQSYPGTELLEKPLFDLPLRLRHEKENLMDTLENLSRHSALYGASWHSVAFLNSLTQSFRFPYIFDDTDSYSGYSIFSTTQNVPIRHWNKGVGKEIDAVIITAYLHDSVISQKLRQQGFAGEIVSIRPQLDELRSLIQ